MYWATTKPHHPANEGVQVSTNFLQGTDISKKRNIGLSCSTNWRLVLFLAMPWRRIYAYRAVWRI